MLPQAGKALIIFGAVLVVLGVVLLLAGRVPFLGRLPGDLVWRREDFTIYVPITTSILVSIVLSVILYLITRIGG